MSVPPSRRPSRRDGLPAATVARLPIYLRAIAEEQRTTISSDDLAARIGTGSAQVRRDLSLLGSFGTRGVGYDVAVLRARIEAVLGLDRAVSVVIVGVGNLGRALASYRGFAGARVRICGLVDADPARVGEVLPCGDAIVPIVGLADLDRVARDADIGVIATPDSSAQAVCDRLIAAGVRSILTFAATVLRVPSDVEVRQVDLGVELQILAFHERWTRAVGA